MKRFLICFLSSLFIVTSLASAQERAQSKRKVVYKYKKFERFDFEDMVIEGESGIPGDLTVTPVFKRFYKNALPVRENFNEEIENAIESMN